MYELMAIHCYERYIVICMHNNLTESDLGMMFNSCIVHIKFDGTSRTIREACHSVVTHLHKTVLQQVLRTH